MGCFSSKGVEISRYREEDRIARQKIEEDEQIKFEKAKIESLKQAEEDEKKRRLEESKEKERILQESKERGKTKQEEEEEEEKKKIPQESKEKGKTKEEEEKRQIKDLTTSPSICKCNGCKSEIGDGISVNAFGDLWHPQCLCCLHCHKPLDMMEIFNPKRQFHKPCYEEYLKCYICDKKLPRSRTQKGKIDCKYHEFWKEKKYCPSHDDDGTAKCCSCERLESCGTKYVMLPDARWLCRECFECAVMDTDECVSLHIEIREFFASLSLKIDKEFHLYLVEREALNEAEKKENIDNDQYGIITRGICLSEKHIIPSITKGPRMGPNKELITDIVTETQSVDRTCEREVTAILILYGFPRILTGSILAHEMMHAWLRINGYQNLNLVLEEGLCQVLAHMWLEPQTYATPDPSSASSSSSRTPPVATTSKKGDQSDYEKRFVEFCKHQIETDITPIYGLGFKKVNEMMRLNHYNIKDTIKDIVNASKATPESKI